MFIPYAKLKRYYPILDKHRWLMPIMQVRRWFMLLRPDVASMAKREIAVNSNLEKTKADKKAMRPQNLLKQNFTSKKPNEKWLTDITQIPWHE